MGGLPDKPLFLALLGTWLLFFHFLGNSTLGYVDTHSLYAWMSYTYSTSKDDELGYIIPLIVLGLCYWKRDELLAAPKRTWWPALALVAHRVGDPPGRICHPTSPGFYRRFLSRNLRADRIGLGAELAARQFSVLLFAFGVPVGTMAETVTVRSTSHRLRHHRLDLRNVAGDRYHSGGRTDFRLTTALHLRHRRGVQRAAEPDRYARLLHHLRVCGVHKKMENRRDHPVGVSVGRRGNVADLTLIIFAAEMVETAKPGRTGGRQLRARQRHPRSAALRARFYRRVYSRPPHQEDDQTEPEAEPIDLERKPMNKKAISILIVFLILIGVSTAFLSQAHFRAPETPGCGWPRCRFSTRPTKSSAPMAWPCRQTSCSASRRQRPSPRTGLATGRHHLRPTPLPAFPDKTWIENNVVLMGHDRTSIHKPEYCLPGQGFTIDHREVVDIPIAQPHPYDLRVAEANVVPTRWMATTTKYMRWPSVYGSSQATKPDADGHFDRAVDRHQGLPRRGKAAAGPASLRRHRQPGVVENKTTAEMPGPSGIQLKF